jgi:hypothetical protein
MSGQWSNGRHERLVIALLFMVGALFLGKAVFRGLTFNLGDFYYTFPGEYAQRWNPTLWSSPDVRLALEYNHGAYFYGPTQYLLLFPIVFLNSYASVATLLLFVYAGVLVASWHVLSRLVTVNPRHVPVVSAVLFAAMFAFLPLSQALIQREFEVVGFLLLVVACLMWASGRDAAAGVTVGCLTWFKYWPIVLVAAFVVHRRWRALAAFVIASVALLGCAHLIFGLEHFRIEATAAIIGRLAQPLGGGKTLLPVTAEGALKSDFCRQWISGRGTQADVRWALCGVENQLPWLSARAVYYLLALSAAAAFLWAAYRSERRDRRERESPDRAARRWTAIWEFSLLTIVAASFVHAHYYYLIVLLLPLAALLSWYLTQPQPRRALKLGVLVASYGALTGFLIPMSWLSQTVGRNMWALYLESGVCLLGIVLLLFLVITELVRAADAPGRIDAGSLLTPKTAAVTLTPAVNLPGATTRCR